ncbi:hypothetical protein B0H15DRAFT_952700 [Mycena belliarum]|uniref:Oxidase ustYa n=1 Tax=Mycena belliarum TaxID=1033014 RepID=A0AAD6XL04_9AGAR|nr:hypothetical protein B0H15DRAFT_952700 [Mycena belliae]
MPPKLSAVLALLLPLLLANAARLLYTRSAPPPVLTTPGLSPRLALPLARVAMDVHNSAQYALSGPLAEAQWAALVPAHGGVVHVGGEALLLGMFHQLRCLDVLRREWVRGAAAFAANTSEAQPAPRAHHCLNYLRQMVLCRADRRLESVMDPFGPHAVQVRGAQTCADWEGVYAFVEGHAGGAGAYDDL